MPSSAGSTAKKRVVAVPGNEQPTNGGALAFIKNVLGLPSTPTTLQQPLPRKKVNPTSPRPMPAGQYQRVFDTSVTTAAKPVPVSAPDQVILQTDHVVPQPAESVPVPQPNHPTPAPQVMLPVYAAPAAHGRSGWQKFCRWLTYQPLPASLECHSCHNRPTSCQPPLYNYFLGSRYTGQTHANGAQLGH
jgi:hypothetical protein